MNSKKPFPIPPEIRAYREGFIQEGNVVLIDEKVKEEDVAKYPMKQRSQIMLS